ncbi:hypothetical protein AVEN_238608-1, partial [Araneus ventricosus]
AVKKDSCSHGPYLGDEPTKLRTSLEDGAVVCTVEYDIYCHAKHERD